MPYTPVPSYKDTALKSNRKFLAAVERAIQLKKEIDEASTGYDEVRMQKILPEMVGAGVDSAEVDGYQVGVRTRKDSTRLDRDKLIVELEALGVDLSILDRCSTKVDGYTYVEIRSPKEANDPFVRDVKRAVGIRREEKRIDRLQRKAASGRR
jgi:hypothetical protein